MKYSITRSKYIKKFKFDGVGLVVSRRRNNKLWKYIVAFRFGGRKQFKFQLLKKKLIRIRKNYKYILIRSGDTKLVLSRRSGYENISKFIDISFGNAVKLLDHFFKLGTMGKRRSRKVKTRFARRLYNRQRMRFFYGNLPERKFKLLLERVSNNNRILSLVEVFEFKLDVLLYRSGFAISVFEAKSLITKGYVLVNGIPVLHVNFIVSSGSVVSFHFKAFKGILVRLFIRLRFYKFVLVVPKYIAVDFERLLLMPLAIKDTKSVKYPKFLNPLNVF